MSVRSLNKVMLIGNLTRDPNMRYTPNGTAVCSFSIATNRTWTPSDGGEKQEKADFHNIVAWSKLAEVCGQLLHKGEKVYLEGRLQTREWQNKDGQTQRTTEVVIDNMILLGAPRGGASQNANGYGSDDDQSSSGTSGTSKKAANSDDDFNQDVTQVQDIADEVDIPF